MHCRAATHSFLDAALSDHGESDIDIFQNFDADIGLRRMTTGSALPTLPQSVPRGRSISWLHWFASATACQVACPPCTDQTGILPQPPGTFTSRLSTDRSSSPLLDITTTATGLLVWRFFCQEVSAERRIFLPSSVLCSISKPVSSSPTRSRRAQELSRLIASSATTRRAWR